MPGMDGRKYRIGAFVVDTAQYRVSSAGTLIPVEPKVFDLLVYLIRHRDRVVSREELFAQVWDGREVSDATLSNHVKTVRKVLGDSGELQQTILTIRGRGYQFVAPVEEGAGGGAGEQQPPSLLPTGQPRGVAARSWRLPLALVGLIATALLLWRVLVPSDVQAHRPYVLVLPFEVSGDSPDARLWADQFTREVVSELREISGLEVPPPSMTFYFVDNRDRESIRQRVPDVEYLLEAAVSVAPDGTMRIKPQLDRLGRGVIWTEEYNVSVDNTNFFSTQSVIATAVAGSLKVAILDDEQRALRELPTKNPVARKLYMEGWRYLAQYKAEPLRQAADLLEQAVAQDPDFFEAQLALGEAYRWLFGYYEVPADYLPKVESALLRALELRPRSAEAKSALGLTYAMAWDWNKAWKTLNEAQDLDPNLALTELGFALYYTGLGNVQKVKESLRRADALEPLNEEVADWGNWALFMSAERDAAREWVDRKMHHNLPNLGMIAAGAAVASYIAGDCSRAMALADKAAVLDNGPVVLVMKASTHGYCGRQGDVLPLLQEAASKGGYTCPYESAAAYLSLGGDDNTEKAVQLLYEGVDKRSNCLVFLHVDPRLKPIREDSTYQPRYLDLLKRVGLDEQTRSAYPQ